MKRLKDFCWTDSLVILDPELSYAIDLSLI